jgi:hypothetical protein
MGLPDSYTQKPNAIPSYFDAIQNAEPPQRFSIKFLENLEFKSTNDRTFISILKDLGFLDIDGVPTERYFRYLDKTESAKVLAEGIRDAFTDLFAVNKEAHKLTTDEVKNKLRTLYAGGKKDSAITSIAKTFSALCEIADFESQPFQKKITPPEEKTEIKDKHEDKKTKIDLDKKIKIEGLQYHINIVLPESRDQAVYDAIFKSLTEHLG